MIVSNPKNLDLRASWIKFPVGARVKLLVTIRQNQWNPDTRHYDIPVTFTTHRVGRVTSCFNAGFRGVEHTVKFHNGSCFGVAGSHLKAATR